MLDIVRKKQKSVLIKVAFALIILSFVFGYAMMTSPGDSVGSDPTVAATVNGSRIDYDEYQSAYSNLYRLYQDIYREQFTPGMEKQLGLRQQAMDALIEQTLLLQESKRLGLDISRQELVSAIADIPAFQENGTFNRERYLQVLSSQRLSPESFEAMQRRQMLVEKVRQKVQAGAAVTDAEIDQEFRDQNEKINLAFARLTPSQFEAKVKVDKAALESYFAERREEFRTQELASLRYVVFEPEQFLGQVSIQEVELEKHYRRHLDRFDIPEQVRASHILFRVPADADAAVIAKKREQAQKVLEEARAGKDFAQLARQHSDDAGSVAQGGELGFFTRGTMVAPFEQTAFSLQPEEISTVVETPFGFHIIKVWERIEAGVKPLAEVTAEVEASLRAEKAGQLAYEQAMDAYNMNRQGGSLDRAAEATGLKIRESALFDRQGTVAEFGDTPQLIATAFTLTPGELARPVRLPQGIVLFTTGERQPSRLPELAEVSAEVEQGYRREQAREMARQAAEQIQAAVREGKSLEAAARTHGAKVEETGEFTRAYGSFLPRLGSSDELAQAAFTLTPEAPLAEKVFEQDGRFVVVLLKERQEADLTALDAAKREELREAVLAREKAQAMEELLQELRSKAEISIAPAIASTFEGGNS
ncbi:MAG: SurA N-terminal domain-containing protein [Desulfuromonadales bacterium]|nr:SurA N-terminal domain-containing protein [Desulfuromonadales bacterium]